jgi:hypothetical protein
MRLDFIKEDKMGNAFINIKESYIGQYNNLVRNINEEIIPNGKGNFTFSIRFT